MEELRFRIGFKVEASPVRALLRGSWVDISGVIRL